MASSHTVLLHEWQFHVLTLLDMIQQKNAFFWVALVSLNGMFWSGCASKSPSYRDFEQGNQRDVDWQDASISEAQKLKAPDAQEYLRIHGEYKKKNHIPVLEKGSVFLTRFPKSRFIPEVYHLKGLSYLAQRQSLMAISQFMKTVELTPHATLKAIASYNLAYSFYETSQFNEAWRTASSIVVAELSSSETYKLYLLKARVAKNLSRNDEVVPNALLALMAIRRMTSSTPLNLDQHFQLLEESLGFIHDRALLERWVQEFDSSPDLDFVLYRLAKVKLAQGAKEEARPDFERINAQFPNSRYRMFAEEYLARGNVQKPNVQSQKVGVVLTLSGKVGAYGKKALQAIQYAFRETPSFQGPSRLVVMDDQGDTEKAIQALEELYQKHQVIAVIGPISSKLAQPMAEKAEQLELPLLTLTQKEPRKSAYVWNAAVTPSQQVQQLVQYAVEKMGLKRFAVLTPQSKFGEEYSAAFLQALGSASSTQLRGHETYPEAETDFRVYIDRLVGLSQTEARAKEIEELELQKQKALSLLKVKNKNQIKKIQRQFALKPIVDFDAIFIPDEPKKLGQILPTFAYRDVENIVFLGIHTWNHPDLLSRVGNFAEGSIFVDGFFKESTNPYSRKFIEEYQALYGTEPTSLEATSYDAARMISAVIERSKPQSHDEMQDRLNEVRDFPGISGNISFDNGSLIKSLRLLTIKGGKIQEIAF